MPSCSLMKDCRRGSFLQAHVPVIHYQLPFLQGLIPGMLESQLLHLLMAERNNACDKITELVCLNPLPNLSDNEIQPSRSLASKISPEILFSEQKFHYKQKVKTVPGDGGGEVLPGPGKSVGFTGRESRTEAASLRLCHKQRLGREVPVLSCHFHVQHL